MKRERSMRGIVRGGSEPIVIRIAAGVLMTWRLIVGGEGSTEAILELVIKPLTRQPLEIASFRVRI